MSKPCIPYSWPAVMLLLVFPLLSAAEGAPSWWALIEQSKPDEQMQWAMYYEHGEGVEQDYRKAVQLYCKAAHKGHAPAQYQLGWLYANGRGVERDDDLAAAWFRLAAKQGDSYAQRMLARVETDNRRMRAKCVLPQIVESPDLQLVDRNSTGRGQIEAWVYELAPEYGLDPALVMAVITAESSFNPSAVSHKNARGLMQLIPATAERFGVSNPLDPLDNLRGGMAYLRWLLAYFQGDVKLALAGYNAGEGAVEKYKGIPPYQETQNYVAKIIGLYRRTMHPPVEQVVRPSTITVSMDAAHLKK